MWIKLRRDLVIGLMIACGSLLGWASVPYKHQAARVSLPAAAMQLVITGKADTSAILTAREVKVKWPSTMRIGDQYMMELDFVPMQNASSPSTQEGGFSDIYRNYNVMAEARYEVAGIMVEPANPIRKSMPSGQPVSFKWTLRASQAGEFEGKMWLSLRFLPLNGEAASQVPVYVKEMSLHAISLWGLSAPWVRLIGGVGLVVGAALFFGDMIHRRRRRAGEAFSPPVNTDAHN